jgi:hypothetical protein
MKAAIRAFMSPDLVQLGQEEPVDKRNFRILVQMLVGPDGEAGEESFDVLVATPLWLLDHIDEEGPTYGRHYLFVNQFDWPAIKAYLTTEVESLERSSWREIATALGRIGKWEFEDYHEI